MTILVPTDFSKLSKVAVFYAVKMAQKLKAKIILLAVINDMTSSKSSTRKWKKLENGLVNIAQEDANQLMLEIQKKTKGKLAISYHYMTGFPVEDMIETFVSENEVDMIVMGTKGATGLKKVLIGTNAAAVIDNSSVPVIAVPEGIEFKGIRKILYASDLSNIEKEIKTLATVAAYFKASVSVLHVIPSDSSKKIDIKKITARLVKISKYRKIIFRISKSDEFEDAVYAFVVDHKVDLLALFTHKLDFYEKLLGRSTTRRLAFHAQLPLLTFNKTTIA